MKRELEQQVAEVCKALFNITPKVELTRPEPKFGEYSTNVALIVAKELKQDPRALGEKLVSNLKEKLAGKVKEINLAGAGFINFHLNDQSLVEALDYSPSKPFSNQSIVAEYSDPNPFKILHVGHVYTTVVGDAIANLIETAGGEVHRVNYGGDVGLHVAKTMWAILKRLDGENPDGLGAVDPEKRSAWLAEAYVEGNKAYEQEEPKAEITELNKKIYLLHQDNDHDSALAKIYYTCRDWSYEAFDKFYARLGTKIERYYPESEVADKGKQLVIEQVGKVFSESEGAIVFKGEDHGLHTRVFINSQGLPTYEAKEVGLIVKKFEDYHYKRSVVVTGNEQEQYMAVTLKAISMFMPELAAATTYVPHGMVRLSGGTKMSSRLGNIIMADEILDMTAEAQRELTDKVNDDITLGAVKYAFLKSRIGGDIIYDPKESVSLEGNSGPYLQYAHARARSILRKAQASTDLTKAEFEDSERALVVKIGEYAEVVDKAVNELKPHHICTYLYELAQVFNRFYESAKVIGSERQDIRLALVAKYADTLKSGLSLLGIMAPDKM